MDQLRRYWGHSLLGLAGLIWVAQLFLPAQGIGFVTGIVVFLIVWWMVFFIVLPLSITSQHAAGDVVPGSEPGAPVDARLGQKMWLTTKATSVIWLVFFVVFEFGLINAQMFEFASPPTSRGA